MPGRSHYFLLKVLDMTATTITTHKHTCGPGFASRASAPRGTPRTYAKRGTKTKAREAAIRAGRKTFDWVCQRGHGLTTFGTSGKGQCRACSRRYQTTKSNE
jgi:cytochrome c5